MQDNNVLMSLAVCNLVDREKNFKEKIILSSTISKLIEPIVKERQEWDNETENGFGDRGSRDKELPKTVTQEIKERRDNLNEIKREKSKKILVMLGQMYNGVIIPEKLSVRRGEFFHYRCQYALGLNRVKQELLNNLHEVTKKIQVSKNIDILEYCLEAWDKEKDSASNYGSYSRRSKEDRCKKDFRFDTVKIAENISRSDNVPNVTVKVTHINGVSVCDNGNVDFFWEMGTDRDTQSLQSENFNDLYLKFTKEIKGLAEDFIKELDDELKQRAEHLKEIKLKGSHLLMSAELQKGSDNIRGYGN